MKSFVISRFASFGRSSSYIGESWHHFKRIIEEHFKEGKMCNIYEDLYSTEASFINDHL